MENAIKEFVKRALDEHELQNPKFWEAVRKVMAENGHTNARKHEIPRPPTIKIGNKSFF